MLGMFEGFTSKKSMAVFSPATRLKNVRSAGFDRSRQRQKSRGRTVLPFRLPLLHQPGVLCVHARKFCVEIVGPHLNGTRFGHCRTFGKRRKPHAQTVELITTRSPLLQPPARLLIPPFAFSSYAIFKIWSLVIAMGHSSLYHFLAGKILKKHTGKILHSTTVQLAIVWKSHISSLLLRNHVEEYSTLHQNILHLHASFPWSLMHVKYKLSNKSAQ